MNLRIVLLHLFVWKSFYCHVCRLQSHIRPLWPETGVQQKKVWVRPDPDPKKGQGTTRSESKKGLGKTESGFKKKALVRLDPDTKKNKKTEYNRIHSTEHSTRTYTEMYITVFVYEYVPTFKTKNLSQN